jgi:hypothetical protein
MKTLSAAFPAIVLFLAFYNTSQAAVIFSDVFSSIQLVSGVGTASKSFTAADGLATFDIVITVTAPSGNVGSNNPTGTGGNWGDAAGTSYQLESGESVTMTLGISDFQANGGSLEESDVQNLQFTKVQLGAASAANDVGTITTNNGSFSFADFNEAQDPVIPGHVPGDQEVDLTLATPGTNTSVTVASTGSSNFYVGRVSFQGTTAPEPSALLLTAIASLAFLKRRR